MLDETVGQLTSPGLPVATLRRSKDRMNTIVSFLLHSDFCAILSILGLMQFTSCHGHTLCNLNTLLRVHNAVGTEIMSHS